MESGRLIFAVILLVISVSSRAEVVYFQAYDGLPDYQKQSPFTGDDKSVHKHLNLQLKEIKVSDKECEMEQTGSDNGFPLKIYSNICRAKDIDNLKTYVKKMAPSLDLNSVSFWKEDLNDDGLPELMIGYVDISSSKDFPYPYLSIWILSYQSESYEAAYAGTYLAGRIHKIEYFGGNQTSKTIFVKHQNCLECEPWVYLTPVRLINTGAAEPYQFTYSEDHKTYSATIEYVLPGMGHSVDAKVNTRIVSNSPKDPHLIQRFDIEQGPKEWWIFTCKKMKCDYKYFMDKLPRQYEKLWSKGSSL